MKVFMIPVTCLQNGWKNMLVSKENENYSFIVSAGSYLT